jgi:hypothetical protein
MSELREKIAEEIRGFGHHYNIGHGAARLMADRILAIPEIREGLYLYSRKKVKAGKPVNEPGLGHSIGTKP